MNLFCKKLFKYVKTSYQPGEVIIDSDTGNVPSSINLLMDGVYQIKLVGGGGGGLQINNGTRRSCGSGGSGSAFVGKIRLTKGTYNISWGEKGVSRTYPYSSGSTYKAGTGGNSVFGTMIAYGGTGGYTSGTNIMKGTGGRSPKLTYTRTSTSVNKAGNDGDAVAASSSQINYCNAGDSVYSGYGHGAGFGKNGIHQGDGTDGIIYLAYVSP